MDQKVYQCLWYWTDYKQTTSIGTKKNVKGVFPCENITHFLVFRHIYLHTPAQSKVCPLCNVCHVQFASSEKTNCPSLYLSPVPVYFLSLECQMKSKFILPVICLWSSWLSNALHTQTQTSAQCTALHPTSLPLHLVITVQQGSPPNPCSMKPLRTWKPCRSAVIMEQH